MSLRDTYNSSVKSATVTKTATLLANETTKQETINASGVNVGYNLQTGTYSTFAAAVKAANQSKRDSDFAAEQARQAAHAVARDTLRATGDLAPL